MKKISKILMLLTLVGLLGLVFLASCDFSIFGTDEECIHDWDDFRVIERATCTSKGKVERTCKLCGVTEQRDTPEADHSYGEFVLVEENDCLRTGKAIRTCNVCGKQDVTYILGDHAYGEWIEAKDATLTEDGCLGHYECSVCGKAFDEDKNPIADAVLPKLAPKLSLCLDGEPRAEFVIASESENDITFIISGLDVLAGQRVTICDTENPANLREFTVSEKVLDSIGAPILGNIDPEEKMIRTDSKSTVTIIYNVEGGIKLSADGYVHSGVVIEMKNYYTVEPVILPMEYVSYYGGDMGAYVFGIFGSDSNTSFRIIDLDTDKVYDYDDISESMAWNTWSYSRGKDGSIVFGRDLAEWWVAFNIGGDGKIVLKRMDRAFARNPALTSGTESIPMEKVDLEVGSDEYKYHTWPLLNGEFYRTELWNNPDFPLDLDNVFIFKAVVDAEGGESFDLSIGTELMKAADHICDIRTARGAVSISGNTITFNTAGKYVIEVVSYCAIINIYDYVEEEPDPHEHEYVDGKCECGAEDPDYIPPHDHIYVDGKCECGAEDPDYIPPHDHIYVDGKCECGAEDPDYVPETPDLEGILIEINGEFFAMNFVTYPSDGATSYVYGYVYINLGERMLIHDTESGKTWGYDDISEDLYWNTWDYHRGEDGEIVFDTTARFGIEFNNNGDEKIYISKVFPPYDGESYGIVFPDSEREDIIFDGLNLSDSPEISEEFMWTLTHATTMNNDDILAYIEENGLWFYSAMEDFEAGEKFSLKNFTDDELIGAEYLVDIMFGTGAITRDGDLVSVLKDGRLYIVYLPAFNSFTVEFHAKSNDVYIYHDGGYSLLTPDEDGNVSYENLSATDTSCIMFADANFEMLPIYLDPEVDESLVDITVYGDYYYAYTKVTGKYNLRYNVNTNELYIEVTEDPVPYDIYIDAYTILTLIENPENPDEMCYLGLEMGAWDEFKVRDSEMNNIIDLTLAAGTVGAETDSRVVIFTEAGTYDIYIHKTTHQVRIVSSAGGGDGEYMIYHEGRFIDVYSSDAEIKYEGLAVSSGDCIALKDISYEDLPISFDSSVDISLAKLYESSNMVKFVWSCTIDLTYNIETGIMMLDIYDVTYANALVYLMYSGTEEEAYADEHGVVTKRFEFEESDNIFVDNSVFDTLPIILHDEVDSSIVVVMEFGEGSMLYIGNPGIYDFTYDLNSKILMFEAVTEVEPDPDPVPVTPSINDYYIFISVVDYTNGNQSIRMTNDPENNEAYGRIETMASGSFISVSEMVLGGDYTTTSYGALADTDASVATSFGELVQINIAGPVDVYFDFVNKTIKIVPVEITSDPDPEPEPDGEIIGRIDILGITMPYTGEKPATDDEPYALQGGVEIISVDWGEETYDEVTGKIGLDPFGADYSFENSGGRYYIRARIRIQDGYQLAYGVEDLCYELIATINYVRCWTIQVEGDIIELYTYIGCNDTTVWHIGVVGVDAPVAGEHPDTDFTCVYEGFHIADVLWYDYTESDGTFETARLMADDESFVEGGSYQVHIVLEADDGHEFVPGYYGPEGTAFINDHETAAEFHGDADARYQILLTWFFDCFVAE